MHTAFGIILALAVFRCSLCAFAVHRNGKEIMAKYNFVDENDLSLDDRETREQASDFNGNWDFHDGAVKRNDEDLYFSPNYDDGMEKRKSVDYGEWNTMDGLASDDEMAVQEREQEKEEEKGMIRKLIEKFKNLLHKIGKRK